MAPSTPDAGDHGLVARPGSEPSGSGLQARGNSLGRSSEHGDARRAVTAHLDAHQPLRQGQRVATTPEPWVC